MVAAEEWGIPAASQTCGASSRPYADLPLLYDNAAPRHEEPDYEGDEHDEEELDFSIFIDAMPVQQGAYVCFLPPFRSAPHRFEGAPAEGKVLMKRCANQRSRQKGTMIRKVGSDDHRC